MKTTAMERAPAIGIIRVGRCLCDEAIDLLESAPIFGRDVVELDAVCQRLLGVVQLLGLPAEKQTLKDLRAVLAAEAARKRMLRAIKRVRKQGRAARDCDAAKRVAAFVDLMPATPVDLVQAGEMTSSFVAVKQVLETASIDVDPDGAWLICRRDYGRVSGLAAAWREGETRVEYDALATALRRVYTQLLILAPPHLINSNGWESLVRTVESLGGLKELRCYLNRSGGRLSPAYVVPRTLGILDAVVAALEEKAADGLASCFEVRPRSYFARLRRP